MILGEGETICCPACSGIMRRSSVLSFNTMNATEWSDGFTHYPMMPDFHEIRRCALCSTAYRQDAAKVNQQEDHDRDAVPQEGELTEEKSLLDIGDDATPQEEYSTEKEFPPDSISDLEDSMREEWAKDEESSQLDCSDYISINGVKVYGVKVEDFEFNDDGHPWEENPTEEDYLFAINNGFAKSEEDELEYLKRVWWLANDRIRDDLERLRDNKFWLQPNDLIEGYIDQMEEWHREAHQRTHQFEESHKKSKQDADGDKEFDEEALEDAWRKIAGEVDVEDVKPDKTMFSELTKRDKEDMLSLAAIADLPEPDVPDEIKNMSGLVSSSEEFRDRVREIKQSVDTSLLKVQQFEYTLEEATCLSQLASLLKGKDDLLLAELLRETGEFEEALAVLANTSETDSENQDLRDAIILQCQKKELRLLMKRTM